jgi:hypothetical protein
MLRRKKIKFQQAVMLSPQIQVFLPIMRLSRNLSLVGLPMGKKKRCLCGEKYSS